MYDTATTTTVLLLLVSGVVGRFAIATQPTPSPICHMHQVKTAHQVEVSRLTKIKKSSCFVLCESSLHDLTRTLRSSLVCISIHNIKHENLRIYSCSSAVVAFD